MLTEKFIKAIAIILVLVMFSQLLPMSVIAEEVNSEDIIEFSEKELAGDTVILGEVIEKRTASSKTFRMSDKSMVYAQYTSPVHYEEDGEMKDTGFHGAC